MYRVALVVSALDTHRVQLVLLKLHSTLAADPPQPVLLNMLKYIVPDPVTPFRYTLPIAVTMLAPVLVNTIDRAEPAVIAGKSILDAVEDPSGAVPLFNVTVGAVPARFHPVPPISWLYRELFVAAGSINNPNGPFGTLGMTRA
jgi:hypothetical protein